MSAAKNEAGSRSNDLQGAARNSVLEYLVAGLGLLLVASALGFMGYKALTYGNLPPDITLRAVTVERSSGGYLVTVEAYNAGDETAAELGVEGTLARSGQEPETSDITFDYLPPGSVREGGLFFTLDPRGALELRVLGYREP